MTYYKPLYRNFERKKKKFQWKSAVMHRKFDVKNVLDSFSNHINYLYPSVLVRPQRVGGNSVCRLHCHVKKKVLFGVSGANLKKMKKQK